MVLYLVDQGTIVKRFSPDVGDHPEPRLELRSGITRTVIEEKQIIEIPNIDCDERVNPVLRGKYKSMIAIPLTLENIVVGVLYLNGKREGVLTETERSFVSTLTNQAAIVVERTRLYQKIRDSEAEYHSLLDHIPQCVFRKDIHSRFTSANEAFCRSLGRRLAEIVGKSDADFYPTELAEKFVRDDREVIGTGNSLTCDEKHQTAGMPDPIQVRVVKTPVRDAEGKITGVQAIFWDVTLEKKLSERYRSLVDQSPDSIVVHKNGKITLANPAAVRLLGVATEDELMERPILDFVDDTHQLLAGQRLSRMNRGETVDQIVEMTIRSAEGKAVEVAVYARPLPGESGIQVVFHDLTRVNTLLREMHHRVRRALNSVAGFLRSREGTESQEVQRVFRAVQGRISAMALVHTILLSQHGQSEVPMRRYLEHLTTAVREAYGDGRQCIVCEIQADDLRFEEKTAMACGLIVNELVSNALLHGFCGSESGRIKVRLVRRGNDKCLLSVADDGCGFARREADRPEHKGFSLVRTFVHDDLTGRMRISSQKGVRVEIRFPLRPNEAAHGE